MGAVADDVAQHAETSDLKFNHVARLQPLLILGLKDAAGADGS
jgi:hypothetical protein